MKKRLRDVGKYEKKYIEFFTVLINIDKKNSKHTSKFGVKKND